MDWFARLDQFGVQDLRAGHVAEIVGRGFEGDDGGADYRAHVKTQEEKELGMHTRPLTLAIILGMTLVTGCGGSGKAAGGNTSTGTTSSAATGTNSPATATTTSATTAPAKVATGPQLSAKQLVAKANAICAHLNAELLAANDRAGNQAAIVRIAPQRAASEQATLAELSALTPPAELAKAYGQILTDRRMLAEDTLKLGQDAAAHDTQAEAPLYPASASLVRQMGSAATRSGIAACARLR
jgi:hypothetical protein